MNEKETEVVAKRPLNFDRAEAKRRLEAKRLRQEQEKDQHRDEDDEGVHKVGQSTGEGVRDDRKELAALQEMYNYERNRKERNYERLALLKGYLDAVEMSMSADEEVAGLTDALEEAERREAWGNASSLAASLGSARATAARAATEVKQKRSNVARALELCFRCMGRGHFSAECPAQGLGVDCV